LYYCRLTVTWNNKDPRVKKKVFVLFTLRHVTKPVLFYRYLGGNYRESIPKIDKKVSKNIYGVDGNVIQDTKKQRGKHFHYIIEREISTEGVGTSAVICWSAFGLRGLQFESQGGKKMSIALVLPSTRY
jgi:hypothetical protein